MAIPDASLPGYSETRTRIETELGFLREGRAIDYKRSASWKDLQWKIVKTALAMANLRDGGLIIVGVSEDPQGWSLTGVENSHLATFEVDAIKATIDKFASLPIQLDIVTHDYAGIRFLAFAVGRFNRSPIICRANGPQQLSQTDRLEAGAIYVRPEGVARTQRVSTAEEMDELIEMAAEARAVALLAQKTRIEEAAAGPTAADRFRAERGDL